MTFSDPQKNIQQFGLIEGMKVADFGAGSAAYTIAAASKVGTSGRVYAVEVQKELLTNIKNSAVRQGLSNVEVIWGDIESLGGTKIQDRSLDAVMVSNVLFQAEDKQGVVKEVKRILKPKGRVLVVDWKDSLGGMGPRADHIIKEQDAKKLFEESGFTFDRSIQAGDRHYGFIMGTL